MGFKVVLAILANLGTIYRIFAMLVGVVNGSPNKEQIKDEIKAEVKKEIERICAEKGVCLVEPNK